MTIILIIAAGYVLLRLVLNRIDKIQSNKLFQIYLAQQDPEQNKPDPTLDNKKLLAQSDADRSEAIKAEYMDLLDAIQDEIDLLNDIDSPSAIRRKTALIRQRATITEKIYKLDRIIEIAYNNAN